MVYKYLSTITAIARELEVILNEKDTIAKASRASLFSDRISENNAVFLRVSGPHLMMFAHLQ